MIVAASRDDSFLVRLYVPDFGELKEPLAALIVTLQLVLYAIKVRSRDRLAKPVLDVEQRLAFVKTIDYAVLN